MTTNAEIETLRRDCAHSWENEWGVVLRFLEKHPEVGPQEIASVTNTIRDTEKYGIGEWYGVWNEIDTGDREGPVREFAGFRPEPDPRFTGFVRALYYDAGYGLKNLMEWPHTAHLKALSLQALHNPSGLIELLSHKHFAKIEHLELNFLPIEDAALSEKLLSLPIFRRLKGLTLSWCRSPDPGVFRKWFEGMLPANLQTLHIDHCDLRLPGIRHLRDSGLLRTIRDLRLRGVYMGAEESRLLSEFHGPFALESLEIEDCALENGGIEMDPASFARLVKSPLCANLKYFKSLYHRAGEAGMAALCESPMESRLVSLSLQNAAMGDAGFRALLRGQWPALKRLSISYDRFSKEMEADLKAWKRHADLEHCYVHSAEGFSSWTGLNR